jgi:uncharacterized membrane protein
VKSPFKMQSSSPTPKDLYWVIVTVGVSIAVVLGFGFVLLQVQLNTVETGLDMVREQQGTVLKQWCQQR